MENFYRAALLLVIVGALNWGLIGLFEFDLVAALFGGQDMTGSRVVYTLVGIAGVLIAITTAAFRAPRREPLRPRTT